jgi:hypothetical protein
MTKARTRLNHASTYGTFLSALLEILAFESCPSGDFKVSVTWEGVFIPYTCSLLVGWSSSFAHRDYLAKFNMEPPSWAFNVHPYCSAKLMECAIECNRELPNTLKVFELGMARSHSSHLDFEALMRWAKETTAAGKVTLAQSQTLCSLLGNSITTALKQINMHPDVSYREAIQGALRKTYAHSQPDDPVARWACYRLGGWFRDQVDNDLERKESQPENLSWLLGRRGLASKQSSDNSDKGGS